jgi:hypothetical protein
VTACLRSLQRHGNEIDGQYLFAQRNQPFRHPPLAQPIAKARSKLRPSSDSISIAAWNFCSVSLAAQLLSPHGSGFAAIYFDVRGLIVRRCATLWPSAKRFVEA